MFNFQAEFRLLCSLILRPASTIREGNLDSYNEKNMYRLYLFIVVPLATVFAFISSIIAKGTLSFFSISFTVLAIGFVMILPKLIMPAIYFGIFKYIGKMEITFEYVQRILFPLFFLHMSFSLIFNFLLRNQDAVRILIQLIVNVWFILGLGLILNIKYMLGKNKIILVLAIPVVFYCFSILQSVFLKN